MSGFNDDAGELASLPPTAQRAVAEFALMLAARRRPTNDNDRQEGEA